MFRFVSTRLRFFTGIPGAPQVFEGLLLLWVLLFRRELAAQIDVIESTVTGWPGVTRGMHRFGGTQFNLGRREIGHIHGNGLVDILFTKQIKEALVSEGRALPHHILPKSNWISFYMRSEEDCHAALALLRLSYERLRAVTPDVAEAAPARPEQAGKWTRQ